MKQSAALPRNIFWNGDGATSPWFSRAGHRVAKLRLAGFRKILEEHRYKVRPLGKRPLDDQSWTAVQGNLIAAIKAAEKPLAVFAYNDFDAALVMGACVSAGLQVPDDIAILGTDDNELVVHSLNVPLSSVRHDLDTIGYEGAALLDILMRGEKPATLIHVIPPRGIATRTSTDTFAVNHPGVRTALQFIKDNLHRSIGVDEIATAAGVSRRTLEEAFQKEIGRTVHEKVMHLRVGHAQELLLTTNSSVQDIAAQTGFCNAPHMHRLFKKYYGYTPRACRTGSAKGHQSAI